MRATWKRGMALERGITGSRCVPEEWLGPAVRVNVGAGDGGEKRWY